MPDLISFSAIINRSIYEFNNKRYIDIEVPDEIIQHIEYVHEPFKTLNNNPLKGNILRVKVPFRYNKVDCTVEGLVPIQSMKKSDKVSISIQFCGIWDGIMYWKISSIRHINKNIY